MADLTSKWIASLESHYDSLWKRMKIPVSGVHPYVVDKASQIELIHPDVRHVVSSLKIRFHSANNPKSSQLLALNLFLLGEKCGPEYFSRLLGDPEIKQFNIDFEWIDADNILKQGGNQSNHDVFLNCGARKYLIEMKFTEHSNAPCSSSKRNGECQKKVSELQCPLEFAYDTEYYRILRDQSNPYDVVKLEDHYLDCPFVHGEQYQIMRYILLCHMRSKSYEKWLPVIILPKRNEFMGNEINLTKKLLKNPSSLIQIDLEEAICIMRTFNNGYATWLTERYII